LDKGDSAAAQDPMEREVTEDKPVYTVTEVAAQPTVVVMV